MLITGDKHLCNRRLEHLVSCQAICCLISRVLPRFCSTILFLCDIYGEGITNHAGADTGGVDRVDILPPFFSKKKNSKCHFI